jgi:hypothetical protein
MSGAGGARDHRVRPHLRRTRDARASPFRLARGNAPRASGARLPRLRGRSRPGRARSSERLRGMGQSRRPRPFPRERAARHRHGEHRPQRGQSSPGDGVRPRVSNFVADPYLSPRPRRATHAVKHMPFQERKNHIEFCAPRRSRSGMCKPSTGWCPRGPGVLRGRFAGLTEIERGRKFLHRAEDVGGPVQPSRSAKALGDGRVPVRRPTSDVRRRSA